MQTAPEVPDGRVCWWTGFGGAIVVNDLEHRVTLAYTMNKMAPGLIGSDRADAYLRATFAAVPGDQPMIRVPQLTPRGVLELRKIGAATTVKRRPTVMRKLIS